MEKKRAINYFVCPFHKRAGKLPKGQMMVREQENYQVKANREYQDSVLTDLFCRWRKADEYRLALHNALHDTNYTKEEVELRDIRLETSLYRGYHNDLSYEALVRGLGHQEGEGQGEEQENNLAHILGYDKISFVFGEHQSTINENMPWRYLSYVSRSYETVLDSRLRYHRRRVQLPNCEFYVFYTGEEDYPQEEILRLSDALGDVDEKKVSLEIEVKVINLNLNKNHPILEKCPILKEYMIFVDMVKRFRKEMKLEEAIGMAIKECIRNGVLKEYLEERGNEVAGMFTAEYDYEEDLAVQKEEAREIGYSNGVSDGRSEGTINTLVDLVKKQLLDIEVAAKQANMKVGEFKKFL